MRAQQVIEAVERLGGALEAKGDRLRYYFPKRTDEALALVQQLAVYKRQLLATLTGECGYEEAADRALDLLRGHESFPGAMAWCSRNRADLHALANSTFAAVAQGWQSHVPLAEFEERLRAWVESHDLIMYAYRESKNAAS